MTALGLRLSLMGQLFAILSRHNDSFVSESYLSPDLIWLQPLVRDVLSDFRCIPIKGTSVAVKRLKARVFIVRMVTSYGILVGS
jgi:hypothetical protein